MIKGLIDAEKVFNKIRYLIRILKKTLLVNYVEGNFSNLIKAIYEKPTASVILNGERLKDFSLLRSSKTEMPDFTTAIQLCSGSSSQRH